MNQQDIPEAGYRSPVADDIINRAYSKVSQLYKKHKGKVAKTREVDRLAALNLARDVKAAAQDLLVELKRSTRSVGRPRVNEIIDREPLPSVDEWIEFIELWFIGYTPWSGNGPDFMAFLVGLGKHSADIRAHGIVAITAALNHLSIYAPEYVQTSRRYGKTLYTVNLPVEPKESKFPDPAPDIPRSVEMTPIKPKQTPD